MAQSFAQKNTLRVMVVRVLIASLVLASGYLVFEFGRIQAGYNVIGSAAKREALDDQITLLEKDIIALNEQIAVLETHRDIDREAYKQVEQSLSKLQAKIQEQQDAIAFYRGIVSPADGKPGLRVQDFRLTRGDSEREYSIRLVLVQALKHDRKVSGDVKVSIAGELNGEQTSYEYADLLPKDAEEKWAFSFRYFQNFDRQLVLPDGFTPERVTVQVESKTRSIASIEKNYAWRANRG